MAKMPETTRAALLRSKLGKPRSPETKSKLSAALKGRKMSAEACLKMSKARTGKKWSDVQLKAVREANKKTAVKLTGREGWRGGVGTLGKGAGVTCHYCHKYESRQQQVMGIQPECRRCQSIRLGKSCSKCSEPNYCKGLCSYHYGRAKSLKKLKDLGESVQLDRNQDKP